MRYKVTNFYKETFYFYNKKDLYFFFNSLNNNYINKYYFNWNNWSVLFSNSFDTSTTLSLNHSVYIGERKIKQKESDIMISIYTKCFYKIYDENNFIIDYKKIFKEYRESIKERRKRKRKINSRSTSRYRKAIKQKCLNENKTSCKREHVFNIYNEDLLVKIRAKRKSLIKCFNAITYDDWYDKSPVKSWKSNKKIKKQWMKKTA